MSSSTWLNNISIPAAHSPLESDVVTDVVIVGGGLTGTLSAYLLGKAGKKVIVLEKKDISNTTTAYTTAWLNCVIDTDVCDLIKMYTESGASKIWHSGMEAIDLIEKIILEEKIDCGFGRFSHFRYATSEKEMRNLRKEHECAQRLGFNTALHDKQVLNFPNNGSLEIKSQAKFHPIKFLIGLRMASLKYGVVYHENTEVQELSNSKPIVAVTKKGKVTADYSIIATYHPFNNPKELFARKADYTSYVIEANIPKNIIPEGLYEDEKNPYHYFRIDSLPDFDRIIFGGEDHRKEIPISEKKNYNALVYYLNKLLPNIKYTIVRKWSGEIIETIDGLPYIGSYSKINPNMLIDTGFSGNGMTYATIASQIFTDIVLKNKNPYKELYNASRKTKLFNFFKKFLDFGREFFGGAVKNIVRF
jgi:glycine/D-amino acid oxidase-like deaminating enzyme